MTAGEKPTLTPQAVRGLTLSRYYLALAKDHGRSDREADAFVTINLLHEAVETFLIAAAEYLNAAIKPRTEFSTYLDRLDEKVSPERLPFRTMLNRLNKSRVQAKHDSVVPDRSEIPTFVASTESFLVEATRIIFSVDFSAVSLLDLLDDGEVKEHLRAAQVALEKQEHADALIESRKALYLVFERRYDISGYADGNSAPNALLSWFCDAPFYARSENYVNDNVKEPFDFIVVDHSKFDHDLVKDGLDPQIFWNLWRLTPKVYKSKEDWLVKNEPDELADDEAKLNSAYVLEKSVDLLLHRQRKRRGIRTAKSGLWEVGVRKAGAKIYKKASRTSEVVGEVPDSVKRLQIQSGTPGLDGGYYWSIIRPKEMEAGTWLYGYIHEDDISLE
jgi:hypothetical protein